MLLAFTLALVIFLVWLRARHLAQTVDTREQRWRARRPWWRALLVR